MEGMFWGVAAMVVKDAIKQPYLKGRDYERNVRQAYRDVDNLKITLDHVRTNCTREDLTTGPHAVFIRRAEVQLKDAYRTLDKEYPRKAGFSRLLEHASTPGAEMTLLDVGKEANQTARGLGDLLSEIRFARMGKAKEADKDKEPAPQKSRSRSPPHTKSAASSPKRIPSPRRISGPKGVPILHPSHPAATNDMDLYGFEGGAISDGFGSPRSVSSGDHGSLFERPGLKPSGVYSPPSSFDDSSRCSSSSRGRHRHNSSSHSSDKRKTYNSSSKKQNLLQPSSLPRSRGPFDEMIKSSSRTRERELALDNLQHGIDNALRAQASSGIDGQEAEEEAMEYLEYALREVLRLQRSSSPSSQRMSSVDQDLCNAVEDLDESMKDLVAARSEKDRKHSLKRVSRSLEILDRALVERKRYQERTARRSGGASRSRSSQRETVSTTSRRRQQGRSSEDGTRPRYSVYP